MSADVTERASAEGRAMGPPGQLRSRWGRADCTTTVYVVIALAFGLLFSALTPPFWGSDEGEHVKRAYVVSDGQVRPMAFPTAWGPNFGGHIPESLDRLILHAYRNRSAPPPFPRAQVEDPAAFRHLAGQPLEGPQVVSYFANTSTYTPLPYLPTLPGLYAAKAANATVGTTLELMRLGDLLVGVALAAMALFLLRAHRMRWLFLVVALLPEVVFQNAVVSVDSMTNGLALVFGALFARAVFLRDPLDRTGTVLLLTSAALLPLTKSAYFVFPMLLVLVPPAMARFGRAGRLVPGAVALVSLSAFVAWAGLTAMTGPAQSFMRPEDQWGSVAPGAQAARMFHDPVAVVKTVVRTFAFWETDYADGFFGTLGFTFVPVPATAIVGCAIAAVLAFGMAERPRASRFALTTTTILLALAALGVFVALYLGFTPVGYYVIDGVQGRYFLPFAALAAVVAAQLVPLRLATDGVPTTVDPAGEYVGTPDSASGERTRNRIAGAVPVLLTAALTLSAVKYDVLVWH